MLVVVALFKAEDTRSQKPAQVVRFQSRKSPPIYYYHSVQFMRTIN